MASEKFVKGKRVLVTGGLGFLGSNLVHRLHGLGAEVTVFDLQQKIDSSLDNLKPVEGKVEIVAGDIRDEEKIRQAVEGKDFIFNFAANIGHVKSFDDPLLNLEVNCASHLKLLEALRKSSSDATVFFPGSRMQFGLPASKKVGEKHTQNPLSIEAIHKMAAEKYYLLYYCNHGIKSVVFRLSNPFGPRAPMKEGTHCILNWFLGKALNDEEITVFGSGKQLRDYIFVDDVMDAFVIAMTEDKALGQDFNLGSGQGISVVDAVEKIVSIAGKGRIKKVPWPKDWQSIETGSYVSDISKIKNVLGWKPRHSFEEGIRKTIEFYSQRQ